LFCVFRFVWDEMHTMYSTPRRQYLFLKKITFFS